VAQRPSRPKPAGAARAQRGNRVAAWWCGRRGFAGGLGVACLARTPQGTDGSCAGHGGATGFSPETADGSGAKKWPSAAAFQGGDRALVAEEGVDESCSWRGGWQK
jgi:hypothetical protein